jgi:predicted MPP superfamily phosphohydrolase
MMPALFASDNLPALPDTLSSVPGAALTFLLFAGACLGHLTLMVALHNWFYGTILSRTVSHLLRYGIGLVTPGAVIAFWWYRGPDTTAALDVTVSPPWGALLAGYLVLCWVMGFGVLPAVTLWRALRRPPAPLVESRSTVVDVAARLKGKPIGKGDHRLMAYLPGNEVFTVELAERTLVLPRLPPALDGLTVLHLSDLHVHGTPDRPYFQQVMDLCAAWEPDVVALTGDVVDSKRHHRWVLPILGRLRWKEAAFAILGNHDSWLDVPLIRRRLKRVGMRVLPNVWERAVLRGVPVAVIGHEGPWIGTEPDLSDCPPELFRLCLSHTPDHLGWARRHGIDLMLSGHVHGGQVRLPLVGSVFVPSAYGRRYDAGTFWAQPTLLHVSRGLSGEHPMRYNCRPEVTRLVLRCGV